MIWLALNWVIQRISLRAKQALISPLVLAMMNALVEDLNLLLTILLGFWKKLSGCLSCHDRPRACASCGMSIIQNPSMAILNLLKPLFRRVSLYKAMLCSLLI